MTIFESVMKGIAFIEANLTRAIGVSDVADAVSYSQFYFSREFTKLTHISVYDYILRRKISEAYKCLFGEGSRIVDLAFRFGFSSHEVFSRAFRKVFGENPSEADVYKPLAVFEAIDGPYLDFLYGLKTELCKEPACDIFFEVDPGPDKSDGYPGGECALMLLGADNPYKCRAVYRGRPAQRQGRNLSFRLQQMTPILRLHHTDEVLAFRYFFEHFYDPVDLGGNYVLARKTPDTIDFLIPAKNV